MVDVIEITINEFKEKIYDRYIKLFPEDEQREWRKIWMKIEHFIEITQKKYGLKI